MSKSMVRGVLSAIAAFFGIGVLVVFTDQLLSVMTHGVNLSATPPPAYFAISVVTDSFYSFLGGYVCAGIAKQSARLGSRILVVGGEAMGIVATVASWRAVPHWFTLALLVTYPLCVAAGSQLQRRGEAARAEDLQKSPKGV